MENVHSHITLLSSLELCDNPLNSNGIYVNTKWKEERLSGKDSNSGVFLQAKFSIENMYFLTLLSLMFVDASPSNGAMFKLYVESKTE